MKFHKCWLYGLMLFLTLALVVGHWTAQDKSYQADDAGFYMEISQEIYLVGHGKGWLQAAEFAYYHRHWKPIFGPDLMVPFLVLAHGDTRDAFRIYTIFCVAALSAGLYFLFTALIPNPLLAFWVSLLTLLSPWLLTDFGEFGSETPWLIASSWFLGFVLRSHPDTLRATWPATAFLALAVLLRPVESTLCLVIPYTFVLLAPLWKERKKWATQAAVIGAESLAALVLLFYRHFFAKPTENYEFPLLTIWALIAAILLYSIGKLVWFKRRGDAIAFRIQSHWTALLAAILIWYLPGTRNLISWILECTNGHIVTSSNNFRLVKMNFLVLLVQKFGAIFLVPLIFWPLQSSAIRGYWRQRQTTLIFLLAVAFDFALIAWATPSRDYRYYHVSFLAMIGLVYATTYGTGVKKFERPLLFLMPALVLGMAILTLPKFLNEFEPVTHLPHFEILRLGTGDAARIRRPEPAPAFFALFDWLKNQIPEKNFQLTVVTADDIYEENRATNPWMYRLRAREQGRDWDVKRYAVLDSHADALALIQRAAVPGGYILTGPSVASGHALFNAEENVVALGLEGCVQKDCPSASVTYLAKTQGEAENGNQPFAFLLFRGPPATEAPHDRLFSCYEEYSNAFQL